MNIIKSICDLQDTYRQWRRHIHAHPELAFNEQQTANFVADQLASYGIKVTRGIGKTGLVGTLKVGDSTKAIGLRADMDALPMDEGNTFAHKSVYPGKMHGCGHDGHTVILLAAARYLADSKLFNGTVHFVFQPAEEANDIGSGAEAMINDGLFERFPMDSIYALHNGPTLKAGAVATMAGPIMASMDMFEVIINGQGTHSAAPHTGVDSLLVASQLVVALQSIVSRNINALDNAVISATSLLSGNSFNVIPDSVTLRGTVRTLSPDARELIKQRFFKMTQQLVESFGASADIKYHPAYPCTVNHQPQTEFLQDTAISVVGQDRVATAMKPIMGSEDFAYMLEKIPGCYFILGNSDTDHQPTKANDRSSQKEADYGLGHLAAHGFCMVHEPHYDFNDDIIPIGATIFARVVERYLS